MSDNETVRLTDTLTVEVFNEELGWHPAGSVEDTKANWPQLAETIDQKLAVKLAEKEVKEDKPKKAGK